MKFNKIKIYSWLLMLVTLSVTSCRDDTFSDYWDNSDEYTVTLNVALEGMDGGTRADDEEEETPHLSGASKIDMLVYAVYYDANKDPENPDWQAATAYEKEYENDEVPFGRIPGHGQSILDVSETLKNKRNGRQPITLTLKKNQKYKVVFWAQNSATEAFVIDDLKKVQMKYKVTEHPDGKEEIVHSINNDEARDAFCRSVDLDGDVSNRNITIFLRRPLAQINVGTRGFDFESITRNSADGDEYLYSKIRINRAARYLNVVTDEIYTTTVEDDPSENSTEAFYTIDYEYNILPAYWRWNNGEKWNKKNILTPEYTSYTLYDLKYKTGGFDTFLDLHGDALTGSTQEEKEKSFEQIYDKEEFLKVHLYSDEEKEKAEKENDEYGYGIYTSMGASMNDSYVGDKSEVFKYLSMSYVLTNSSDEYQDVLTNVKVWVAQDANGKGEVEIANLVNVPVQRNHRTNIVGNLLTAQANMEIVVDQDFAGRKIEGEVKSGEIVEGFYYDASANNGKGEFQISSLNGLLFFQQLVNGDLTVRQVSAENVDQGLVGTPYPYYDPNDANGTVTRYLKYKSYNYGDFPEDVANIIINGSKYSDFNKDNEQNKYLVDETNKAWKIQVLKDKDGWPEYNNFPFYGATVKLMADIDLAGIEWIPIGFDCANWDTTFGAYSGQFSKTDKKDTDYHGSYKYTNNQKTISYISLTTPDNEAVVDLSYRRAFCGTFDGNGHTIYNLTTKKFGLKVHDDAIQFYKTGTNMGGPYDNVQWFEKGFFGVVGPRAVIKDLRLQNVEIEGNNGVGGIVAQVSSLGFPAKIKNCVVDGGTIDAKPLYRGNLNPANPWGRDNARGCYIGGIVGQFCGLDVENDKCEISNCEVRNLKMVGYRRMGGIVGGIADQGTATMGTKDIQLDIIIKDNSVSNTTMVINQYRPFNSYWDYMGNGGDNKNVWMNGWGWGSGADYMPMTNEIVGGYYQEGTEQETVSKSTNSQNTFGFTFGYALKNKYADSQAGQKSYYDDVHYNNNNVVSNLQYTELAVSPDAENTANGNRYATYRSSTIGNVPLDLIPMFSSFYTDRVVLENNYYGPASLYTDLIIKERVLWLYDGNNNSNFTKKNYKFYIPLDFPNGCDMEYNTSSGKVGMYAETVTLDGSKAPGGRSVITPTGVSREGSCVMYVTSRNRFQFKKDKTKKPNPNDTKKNLAYSADIGDKWMQPTTLSNLVLRGSPYAWAGIILAPNKCMTAVNLNKVTIYDVYQTLALKEEKEKNNYVYYQNYTVWQDASVDLNCTDCNFRGYTVPGEGWSIVNYERTTFEQGSETTHSSSSQQAKNDDGTPKFDKEGKPVMDKRYRTCKVEAPTNFTGCFFKAPFYIDLETARKKGYTVNFNSCNATSAYANTPVNPPSGTFYIEVTTDVKKGKTVVTYYGKDGNEIK